MKKLYFNKNGLIEYTVGNSYVLDFVPLPRRLIARAHLVLYQYLEHK